MQPGAMSAACSLVLSCPFEEHTIFSKALSCPRSWVSVVILSSTTAARYKSFRERVPAQLPGPLPTHVSTCHRWELSHHNPAHNAPLKTFQQLN